MTEPENEKRRLKVMIALSKSERPEISLRDRVKQKMKRLIATTSVKTIKATNGLLITFSSYG